MIGQRWFSDCIMGCLSTAELDGRGTSSSNIGTHPLNWQIRDSDARDIDFAVTGVV